LQEYEKRQTNHATKKCVGTGGITCIARASLPNNRSQSKMHFAITFSCSNSTRNRTILYSYKSNSKV